MFGTTVKLRLDRELYHACEAHARQAGYSSVGEFVHHTLEVAVRRTAASAADDAAVAKHLKGLGYIE